MDEIVIKITPQERDLLLESYVLNPALIQRLKIAEIKGKLIIVKYSLQELEELVEFIAGETNHAEDKKIEIKWDRLYNKLADVLDDL